MVETRMNYHTYRIYITNIAKIAMVILSVVMIWGCGGNNYAPVVSLVHQANIKNNHYIVQKGDTLYSIAWAFDCDFRDLARVNHLKAPFSVYPGQKLSLQLSGSEQDRVHTVATKGRLVSKKSHTTASTWPAVTENTKPRLSGYKKSGFSHTKNKTSTRTRARYSRHVKWGWPAKGKVIKTFHSKLGTNNGIDIYGRVGEPIHASASGTVVYSGSGVRGYGNLLIIKHNDNFLSAYAYNRKLLVKQGAHVKYGQKIATMGLNTQGKSMLHFEIRKNGNPINPISYLSSKRLA